MPAEKNAAQTEKKTLTPEQREKWEEKKTHASERIEKLNAELNAGLAERIVNAFKNGVDMHCPHGMASEREDDGRKFANYYTGLNAIILATEMKEQKFYYPTFVDSRAINNMQKHSCQVSRKKGAHGIKLHSAVQNIEGETILDTRTVYNVYQLQGKDAPQEEYLNSPREDFMFEQTVGLVVSRIQEAQKANQPIDIVAMSYDARREAIEMKKERDGQRKERLEAIQSEPLTHKPKNLAQCLSQECRKSIEAHQEGYNAFVLDGVKRIMLDRPQTKWADMAKAIQEVAPVAVYDGAKRTYANFVKGALGRDKTFQQELQSAKAKSRGAAR